MKETGRDESADRNFESFLSKFRRKPAPAGLKERIFQRLEEQGELAHLEAAFTPAMRRITIFCLAVIALTLWAEIMITRSETQHFQALWPLATTYSNQPVEDELNSIRAEWSELSTYEKSLSSLRSARKKASHQDQRPGFYWQIKFLMEELNGS
ncbi:MAG: hypothetical protein H5U05_10500 [Candidatus Aminicenantes bacterium]|nr:hypothetical protein [Candidatus Aminicenantes bacterium]